MLNFRVAEGMVFFLVIIVLKIRHLGIELVLLHELVLYELALVLYESALYELVLLHEILLPEHHPVMLQHLGMVSMLPEHQMTIE
jgi:hypothetical protein